jgi:hypothetical protein
VQALVQLADTQVHKIAENPSNVRLSPLLAKSFLWFLNRWAPAYVYPVDYGASTTTNPIIKEWSTPEKAQHHILLHFAVLLPVLLATRTTSSRKRGLSIAVVGQTWWTNSIGNGLVARDSSDGTLSLFDGWNQAQCDRE